VNVFGVLQRGRVGQGEGDQCGTNKERGAAARASLAAGEGSLVACAHAPGCHDPDQECHAGQELTCKLHEHTFTVNVMNAYLFNPSASMALCSAAAQTYAVLCCINLYSCMSIIQKQIFKRISACGGTKSLIPWNELKDEQR
jgi:hypothetical protein